MACMETCGFTLLRADLKYPSNCAEKRLISCSLAATEAAAGPSLTQHLSPRPVHDGADGLAEGSAYVDVGHSGGGREREGLQAEPSPRRHAADEMIR
eukprot:6192323-Pleurochrysis_carterae.AAC.2